MKHGNGRGGKKWNQKTYSKKGKRNFEKQQQQQRGPARFHAAAAAPSSPVGSDDEALLPNGALIGLHEGIVVEWGEGAFDHVFGGSSPNDMQGSKTYARLQTLEDPALQAKQKARQQRRKNGIALDDCLDEFEKEEILSEQDTWYCPRCKEHRRASKKFDLWKTPDILVVHLKRFSSSGWRRDKLDILVDFPVENLDLTKRVIDKEDGKEEIYDLIAVDDHWGGLGGGHYTAFAKNFVDGEWYEYNGEWLLQDSLSFFLRFTDFPRSDASVTKQKDTARMVTSAAYLLFYRRRSSIPLGGPKFQEIFDRFNQPPLDDDMSDSGEGQRLGQGSSLRGSPSALTGAGPALLPGSRGWDNDRRAGGSHDDDADMLTSWSNQDTLHNSIEGDGEDEAIGLSDYDTAGMAGMTSVISQANWSFDNLHTEVSKPGSEIDDDDGIASDIAQNDGSSINGDINDVFDNDDDGTAEHLLDREPGSNYIEPAEPSGGFIDDYNIPPPPMAVDDGDDFMSKLAAHSWVQQQIHTVPPIGGVAEDDVASDKAVDIHVSDAGAEVDGEVDEKEPGEGEKQDEAAEVVDGVKTGDRGKGKTTAEKDTVLN